MPKKTVNKTVNIKAKAVAGIGDALEQAYLDRNDDTEFKTKKSFSPSTVGGYHGNCPRYWVRAFNGATFESDKDAQSIYNMWHGTMAHERLQELFGDAKILSAKEIEIRKDDPPIHGFIDCFVKWNDETIVGEIKTTRQEAFMVRQATMKPVPQHYVQLLLYLWVTGKERGFLIYENRNDGNFLVIPVVKNEKSRADLWHVVGWMREVHKAFTDEEMPKIPYRSNSKICKDCPIKKECWEDKENWTVEIGPLEVPKP